MNKETSKIGEAYRDAFKDFKAEPSKDLWGKIGQHPSLNPGTASSWLRPMNLFIGGAALVTVVTVALLTYSPSGKQTLTDQDPQALTEQKTPATPSDAGPSETVVIDDKTEAGSQEMVMKGKPSEAPLQTAERRVFKAPVPPPTPVQLPEEHVNTTDRGTSAVSSKQEQNTPAQSPQEQGNKPVPTTPQSNTPSALSGNNPIEFSPDQIICKGESAELSATGGESYAWSSGETSSTITVSPSFTTVYTVTVADEYGRQVLGAITVKVSECQDLYIPNAFTPNGDNENETFRVFGEKITGFRMLIAARNGQIVFETEDILEGWDGRINGKIGETGIYVYQISYTDTLGKSHKKTGQLMLIR